MTKTHKADGVRVTNDMCPHCKTAKYANIAGETWHPITRTITYLR